MQRPTTTFCILVMAPVIWAVACTGGGSSSGSLAPGGGRPVTPPVSVSPPEAAGLCAIAAGDGVLRLDWHLPNSAFEAALFQGGSRASVFGHEPFEEELSGDHLILRGLQNDVDQFFVMGVRRIGDTEFKQAGVVLRSRPAAPIYVDAEANAGVADGTSPATAFADLQTGIDAANRQGGGNLWLRSGCYKQTVRMPSSADIYGGFPPGFDLEERDHLRHEVRIVGSEREAVMILVGGSPGTILDGLVIDGGFNAENGIDAEASPLEIRSTRVDVFAGRGMGLRNSSTLGSVDVTVTNCSFSGNGAEGLSVEGAYDLRIHGSLFNSNQREGLDIADLVALDDGSATLKVSGCQFFGNGTEGLDVGLAAPSILEPNGGTFFISIKGSSFERNLADGLLVDMDYEFKPGWASEILIHACVARANGAAGIHIDADAPGSVLVSRVLCNANRGDGIAVTSESDPGFVQVLNSLVAGNLGIGMHACFGNKAIVASHCLLAGNLLGGLVSDRIESTASSSIAYLQPFPWVGTRTVANVEITDAFPHGFANAATAFAQAVNLIDDTLELALEWDASLSRESILEIRDDGIARGIENIAGNTLVIFPAPDALSPPASVAIFAEGTDVCEDYRLVLGSPAIGQGLAPIEGEPIDAGLFAHTFSIPPGLDNNSDPPLFRIIDTQPQVSLAIFPAQPLLLTFSAAIDPNSIDTESVEVVSILGQRLDIAPIPLDAKVILINPPATGWGTEPITLRIHRNLLAQSGSTLASSLTLPFLILL